ncbi:hypothetical protein E2562_036129 [Oryza meyeriana var. granulata]|uniref:Uncharacterized protein n=1 Tax=Oryza meyeriana var. granulata TaxID=110450 RepID=A0A6G1E6A4_9ORYZ|nr:hypothetical protein E2562_036129 [Oryza meyeriana var. granulata]
MGRVGCLCFLFFLSCSLVIGYVSNYPDAISGRAMVGGTTEATPSPEKGFDLTTILLGGVLSAVAYATPFVVHWSTGSNPNAFMVIYTNADIISTGSATFAWLFHSLIQLHGADGRIVGAAAVVIYSIVLVIFCAALVYKFCPNGVVSDKVCHTTVISLLIMTVVLLFVGFFGPVKSEDRFAKIISAIAAVAQVFSSLVPYADLCNCCIGQDQAHGAQVPRIRNKRKLGVYIRSLDACFTLYWAVYCIHHYEHSTFWLANIASAILSWTAAFIYISKALKPVAGDGQAWALRHE